MRNDGTDNFADFGDDEDFNWGETAESDEDGISFDNEGYQGATPDELVSQDAGNYQNEDFNTSRKSGGFGYKTVGVLLLIVAIILAGIFIFFDKITVKRKEPVQQTQVSQGTENVGVGTQDTGQGESQGTTSEPEKIVPDDSQSVTQPVESSGGMVSLPPDVAIDYTGEVYETSGQIHNKLKYLDNSQVVYCVQVNAKIGEGNRLVNYYCGYNVFDSVTEGDNVTLTYQIVSDTCYSVNTITK